MTLPKTMTYIATDGAGGPEVMRPVAGPVPQPKPYEVLIRVLAAGVNRPDIAQRQGALSAAAGRQPDPGPGSGGRDRGRRRRGGDVACRRPCLRAGQWRRLCRILRRPGDAMPALAARLRRDARGARCRRIISPSGPTCSCWAGSARGESLLVHGGSSGIGVTAIQLADAFGSNGVCRPSAPTRRRRPAGSSARWRRSTTGRQDFLEEISG